MSKLKFCTCFFSLIFLVLLSIKLIFDSNYTTENIRLSNPYENQVTKITNKTYNNGYSIIIQHGLQCNPGMFRKLAKYFSKLGFSTYLTALPGHASGNQSYNNPEIALTNASTNISNLILKENIDPERLILIGHSLGSTVVGNLLNSKIKFFVFMDLPFFNNFNFVKSKDILFILANESVSHYQTKVPEWESEVRSLGADSKLIVIPHTDHIGLAHSISVYQIIYDWIWSHLILKERKKPETYDLFFQRFLMLLFLILFCLCVRLVFPAKIMAFNLKHYFFVLLKSVISVFISTAITRFFHPLFFINKNEGQDIVSLFSLYGIIFTLLNSKLNILKIDFFSIFKKVALGFFLFLFVQLSIAFIFQDEYTLQVFSHQISHLMTITLLLIPFFYAQSFFRDFFYPLIFSGLCRILVSIIGFIGICFGLYFQISYVPNILELKRFFYLFSFLLTYLTLIYFKTNSTNSKTTWIVFSSLVTSWIITCGFSTS